MHYRTRIQHVVFAAAIVATIAGCAKGDSATTDTAATAPTPAASATDSGMAGMDHSSMAGMNRPAAKDGDHEFLRMMADHHEGMIQMATAAMTNASTAAAKGDAHAMHTKQAEEQKKMIGMVQASYGETVTPMLMPSNKSMMDAMQGKTGAEYDKAFYANVVAHHREALKMVDDMMPRMSRSELKQMAEKMKADQMKEIAALERKMK